MITTRPGASCVMNCSCAIPNSAGWCALSRDSESQPRDFHVFRDFKAELGFASLGGHQPHADVVTALDEFVGLQREDHGGTAPFAEGNLRHPAGNPDHRE